MSAVLQTPTMIEVDGLTKHYGPTRSIEDLSFSVPKGDILGFLGPNGAGKSTTMRILAGIARPTRGSARIEGEDVQQPSESLRRKIGYLPENSPFYGDMTLGGYLRFMAGVKGLPGREARREMERVTELVNLSDVRHRLMRNLSRGMRQRACFAQALLGSPPVLILDEPTVGLDPSQINDVRRLIRSLAGECTVILSTHILPEVELVCSRVVIIANGRIAAQGTPEELVSREGGNTLAVIVRGAEGTFREKLSGWPGGGEPAVSHRPDIAADAWQALLPAPANGNKDPRPELARGLVEAGLDLLEMRPERLRLEDIFLRAIGK